MRIYKCTNERTKTQEKAKHITIIDRKEKETTRDKNMTILIGLLRQHYILLLFALFK